MRTMRASILLFAVSCLGLLGLGQRAVAQCSAGSQWDGVALQAGSPFQAEKTTTLTREREGKVVPSESPSMLIARDGQGRVRTERTEGKFKVEEGEGVGTEAVQHIITICDPVGQKLVRLDTLNKTATVQVHSAGVLGSGTRSQGAFCSVYAKRQNGSNSQKEDLGHQTIEGLDAEGIRTTRSSPAIRNGEAMIAQSVSEAWCSDELGALLLQSRQTGTLQQKVETKLTKIARGEPDPALFQIPADYRIVERVPEVRRNEQMGTVASVPATQAPVPPQVPSGVAGWPG
jgi:hypothetical protein